MMSDEQTVDMMAGLHAVVAILEAIRIDLGELYRRHEIGPTEHVRLDSLGWAVDRLGDDLHDVNVELRSARLEVASARREASEAQQKQQAEQLQSLSVFNGLRHELETVKAERDRLREQVAEIERETVEAFRGKTVAEVAALIEATSRAEARLSGNSGGLPPEPAEPYQWQVGDIIEGSAFTRRRVEQIHDGWVLLQGMGSPQSQPDWERRGWKLFRKALPRLRPRHVPLEEDLPEVPPPSPQPVAEFAEATEPCDDDVSAAAADEGRP